MTVSFLFWFFLLLALLFGGWRGYNDVPGRPFYGFGFLLWILLFLLGVGLFGWPIKG